MKLKKKIPPLRFPEFEGEWQTSTLEDLFTFKNGLNKEKEYFGHGTPIINFKDVFNNPALRIENVKGLVLVNDKEKENYSAKEGDVFFTRTSEIIEEIGISAALMEPIKNCVFSGFVLRARPKNSNLVNVFKQYCFSTPKVRKEIITKSSYTTRALTSGTLLNGVIINYPLLKEEQRKIGELICSVDNKIHQLSRKKLLLVQYKKGVMQKIFSQEIRFKNENGKNFSKWEELRGKDIFYSHSNKNHNGELPILAATQENGMVHRDSIGIEIQSSEKSIRSYKIVEKGDFVISLRSFQGGIEYSEFYGICSPAYTILKPKRKIDDSFFKFYFKKEDFIERLSKTVVGIRDGKQISYDAFGGLKLIVPSLDEQRKISKFLSRIERKIEISIYQLENMQQYKKGLLQQMFI